MVGERAERAIEVGQCDLHNPPNTVAGWIRVGASELTQLALLEALDAGHFYTSTGGSLVECDVRAGAISLRADDQPGERYTI